MTDWGSVYGAGASSGKTWADVYGTGGGVSTGGGSHHSGGGGGLLGLVENLGHDVASTIHDAPSGIVDVAHRVAYDSSHYPLSLNPATDWSRLKASFHDPKSLGFTERSFVNQERNIYGSAAHGNFHPLYQHPLQPILDLATVATGGGAAAAKLGEAGLLGERVGEFARAPRLLRSEDLEEPLNSARTLQGRYLQRRFDRYSMANPDKALIGANPRLARVQMVRSLRRTIRASMPARQFQRVTAGLTKDEKFAFHVGSEGVPLHERIDFYRQELRDAPTPQLRDYVRRLESPKVADALANPSDKLVEALHEGKSLEAKAGERLVEAGHLTPETRADRALLPQQAMSKAEDVSATANRVHESFPAPFRFPHIGTEAEKPGLFTSPSMTAGLREPRLPGFLRRSEAVRLRTARLMTNPEVLTQDFLATMRHEHLLDLRKNVLRPVAKLLDKSLQHTGGKAPGEFYFYDKRGTRIPREIGEQQGLSQDLGVLDEHGRDTALAHSAQEGVFSANEMPAQFRGKTIEQLNEMGVRRVPKAFAEQYRANFTSTSKFMRLFIDRPLDVWRALTLNFRPAWMVNNLVGNAVQYGLRYAGAQGAANYLRVLLRTERGEDKVLQLWRFTKRVPTLRRKYGRIFEEVAPEIHGSGLYGANVRITRGGVYQSSLDRIAATKAARALGVATWLPRKAIVGVGRGITAFERHIAEAVPREAAMLNELRPVVSKLGLANRSLEDALRSLSPRDVELAIDRVNDYLGDFNSMRTPARRWLKRIVPFESWYRVIAQVSAKFALHYPARVNLLRQLGLAYAQDDQNLPSWLKGALGIGTTSRRGVKTMLTTQGLNPFETLPQLASENPASTLNPFLQGLVTALTNTDPFTGQKYRGLGANSRADILGTLERLPGAIGGGLVPVRLYQQTVGQPTSTLYSPHTYGHLGPVALNDYLLSYLGLPIRHVNRRVAAEYATEGR